MYARITVVVVWCIQRAGELTSCVIEEPILDKVGLFLREVLGSQHL